MACRYYLTSEKVQCIHEKNRRYLSSALQYLCATNLDLWAMCRDVGGAHFGQATTNIIEGFNGTIIVARFLPVTVMMEYIFYMTVIIVNTEGNRAVAAIQEN